MKNCWNPEIETIDREKLKELQSERLIKTVKRVYENVPTYKKRMDEKGVTPDDIKSIDDLKKLPFTYKQDLRDTYPYGMFAAPKEEITRVHASSGTTGKQTVVGYTKNDLDIWSECMARVLTSAGASNKSYVQISYGYGLFTGGLGAHYGAEKIGAAVIPTSSGNTARQITVMRDFGTNVLCCTPSYALYLGETIKEMGIDPKTLSLYGGVFGAEPWTDEMREKIEELLNIRATDVYGLSEIMGPGVSFDCEYHNGLHVNEDHFVPEIIDPVTEETLPYGTKGELVFSCITKEGLPLLRYRTRDIASLHAEKCECGRTLIRMSKVSGRTDDMLIIRGVNVFPSQVESVLLDIGKTAAHYMIIVDRVGTLDTVEIQVELTEDGFSDEVKHLESLENEIRSKIQSTLGLAAKIKLVPPKTIARSEGKAVRVIDNRKSKGVGF